MATRSNQSLADLVRIIYRNVVNGGVLIDTDSDLQVGNSSYRAVINSTFFSETSNNALYLGGILANNYVVANSSGVINKQLTFASNIIFANTSMIYANGQPGTAGQMLFSNGTSVYWSSFAPSKITLLDDVDANNLPGQTGSHSAPANNSLLTYRSDYDKYYVLPLNVADTTLSNTEIDGGNF
jgi:hypothetical protein